MEGAFNLTLEDKITILEQLRTAHIAIYFDIPTNKRTRLAEFDLKDDMRGDKLSLLVKDHFTAGDSLLNKLRSNI